MNTQHQQHQSYDSTPVDHPADIELNKPSKARFLFLLFFFGFFVFCWAGCYNLYEHQYKSSADQAVPDNTKYEPVYK